MRGDRYNSQTGGAHFVTKTSTHPGEGGTVPAGTLHWQSLPRVLTAVTSTQTIRDGSTVLHHNTFILNCDFPEGSLFQRGNPTTYKPGHTTCNLLTSCFYNSTDTCSKHPSPGIGSGHNVTKFPSFQTPAKSYLQAAPLTIPARRPLRVCPNTHLSTCDCSQLPDSSTWCSCAASARTV